MFLYDVIFCAFLQCEIVSRLFNKHSMREDDQGEMYLSKLTEVEVRKVRHVLAIFQNGKKSNHVEVL